MELERLLSIRPGVTALIGGGGKTTLLDALGKELSKKGSVILCTTTHIYPPDHLPCLSEPTEAEVQAALTRAPLVCVGGRTENGKFTAPPIPMARLAELARYVIVEADGARGRPLKAHAAHEPVIPAEANQTILVIGASGLGKPVCEAVHRPELFCAALGISPEDTAAPEREAAFVEREALHDRVLINQADTEQTKAQARRLAELLCGPVCIGALQKGEVECWQ